MRAMRYEVFAWAESACRAPGALDHPLAPLLDRHARVRRVGPGRVRPRRRARRRAARLEAALGVAPSGLAERVLGNVLYIIDRSDLGNAEAARQIELAEESGNDSRLVHACYMASVALSSEGRYDERPAPRRPGRTSAREHTQSPTDLASAAVAEGFAVGTTPTRSTRSSPPTGSPAAPGNRWMSAFAHTEASGLLVARGEVDEGCAGLAEMVDALVPRRRVGAAVAHPVAVRDRAPPHRDVELAMELVGAIEAHATLGVAPMTSILHDVAFDTRDDAGQRSSGTAAREPRYGAVAPRPVEDIVLRTRARCSPA